MPAPLTCPEMATNTRRGWYLSAVGSAVVRDTADGNCSMLPMTPGRQQACSATNPRGPTLPRSGPLG